MMGLETGDRSSCKRDCQGMTGPRVLVRTGMMIQVDLMLHAYVGLQGALERDRCNIFPSHLMLLSKSIVALGRCCNTGKRSPNPSLLGDFLRKGQWRAT